MFDCAHWLASGDVDVDAFPIRHFVSRGFECISCQSFSKNMGLYNERAGLVSICTKSSKSAAAKSQLEIIVRHMYSNPPAHGARIAGHVLSSLGNEWRRELASVTGRIISMRAGVAERVYPHWYGLAIGITLRSSKGCFASLALMLTEQCYDQRSPYLHVE